MVYFKEECESDTQNLCIDRGPEFSSWDPQELWQTVYDL